jgi:hypothetical protein
MPSFLRYSDQIEVRKPDEESTFREIAAVMGRLRATMFDRYRHAVRSVHAKSHGVLKGELTVYDDLAPEYAQGLFAAPGRYGVVGRLSTVPGDILSDKVSTPRGLALKIIGASGDKLPGHGDQTTQDFVLVNGSHFAAPDAEGFLKTQKLIEANASDPEFLKEAISAVARNANAALKVVGLESETLGFFGYPEIHILGDTFFSQAAIRYGDYVAKICVVPLSENVKALKDAPLDMSSESAIRDAVVAFFDEQSAEYEIQVQLCTDLDSMPVEDASVPWPEDKSPYVGVGKITFPKQAAYSPARRVYVDDALSFSPWHGLAAHQPLGSVMRARRMAYEPSAKFRNEMNARPRAEPRHIGEVPD